MPSRAFVPKGTQLQIGSTSDPLTAAYTTIAETMKISKSGSKADIVDVTSNDSVGNTREYLATLISEGEVSFECNFVPGDASQKSLDQAFSNQSNLSWKIVLPNALGNSTFNAFVISRDFDLPIDSEGKRSIKLQITGPVTNSWDA